MKDREQNWDYPVRNATTLSLACIHVLRLQIPCAYPEQLVKKVWYAATDRPSNESSIILLLMHGILKAYPESKEHTKTLLYRSG